MKQNLKKLAILFLFLLFLGILTLYILFALVIRTPFAAHHVSRLVSAHLGQTLELGSLGLAGQTIVVKEIRLHNGVDFGGGPLVFSRSVAITPLWLEILRGRSSFADVSIDGLELKIERNSHGDWNFEKLARLRSQEQGKNELFLKHLRISGSVVSIDGFRLQNLDIEVHDLSTKGTDGTRIALTGTDAEGNPFEIQGSGQLGVNPSGDLKISTQSFAPFPRSSESLPPDINELFAKARLAVLVNLKLQQGKITAAGRIGIEDAVVKLAGKGVRLKGELKFDGRYQAATDEAHLDSCSLNLNDMAQFFVSGTVRHVTARRSFNLRATMEPAQLSGLATLLPPELRRDFTVNGTLHVPRLNIAGDTANGITTAAGTVVLAQGTVLKAKQLLMQDLSLKSALNRTASGWLANGTIRSGSSKALLQRVNAPFSLVFSPRLTLVHADIPDVSATVLNMPAIGSIAYGPGQAPLAVHLEMHDVPLAALKPLSKDMVITSGRGRLAMEMKGRSPAEFSGTAVMAVDGFTGRLRGKKIMLQSGRMDSSFSRAGGKMVASGEAASSGASFDGKKGALSVAYQLDNARFSLKRLRAELAGAKVAIAGIQGQLPLPVREGKVRRMPVHASITGLTAQLDDLALISAAGVIGADLLFFDGKRWLQGDGTLTVGSLSSNGTGLGSASGAVRFRRSGTVADIEGVFLGGDVRGSISLSPVDQAVRSAFNLTVSGVQAGRLTALKPGALAVTASAGLLGGRLSGEYQRGGDLQLRLEAEGAGLGLVGTNGRTLVRSGGLKAIADLSGDTLHIREVWASAGDAVTIRGSGAVTRPFLTSRTGHIALALAPTSLEGLLSAFIDSLPRMIQEATATGTVGAKGEVRISSGRTVFDGAMSLAKAGLDIPSQKFSIVDMTGVIPLSLDLLADEPQPKRVNLSRETFLHQLRTLKMSTVEGKSCSIGRVSFGGIDLGPTELVVRAGNGLMQLVSLESTLFRGTLLGDGFFKYGRNMSYGGDLLVSDLSLTALCNTSPHLKNYLSGKVDGFFSFSGTGVGVNGLHGLLHVWAHKGKDEAMLVSKEFLQKLAGKNLKGIFFRSDRPFDRGEIRGYLEKGYLTFDTLDISNTNFFGIKDLSVTVAPVQNRIALDHLLTSIREAATRGKTSGADGGAASPLETEFKWEE